MITRRLNGIVRHIAGEFPPNWPFVAPHNVTLRFTGQFPDPQKAAEDLHTFAKLNEDRLYKLLSTCMDTQTDLKSLIKATVSVHSSDTAPELTLSLPR
jgi:hypothetical protein